MKALSDSTTPQGVVAVARRPDTSLSALPADASLVLMLVNVGDPGNAGTLVRSAAAAGADAVVFATGSVDPFSPKTVRASAGLVARAPVVTAGLDGAVERLRAASITLIGAEASAERSCYEVDLSARIAIVVGNEAAGLPPGARTAVDTTVSIPMPGGVESLNVGIAGSLLLYEAVRQRRYPDAAHD